MTFQEARDQLWRLSKSQLEAQDDPITMYAPSECRTIIERHNRMELQQFEDETGWAIEDIVRECATRTSWEWVHNTPLWHACPVD